MTSDPFGITYEGARKGIGAFGEAFGQIAQSYAERKQKEREMRMKGEQELVFEREKGKIKKDIELETAKTKLGQATEFIKILQAGDTLGGAEKKSGIGITGYDLDPISGDLKVKFGQTPEAETAQAVDVDIKKKVSDTIERLAGLTPILDQFDNLLKTVPVSAGPAGKIEGLKYGVAGALGLDPFAATASSQLDALRPQIVKGLGDVGNFSIPEQKTAQRFVPLQDDPDDTRIVKTIAGLEYVRKKIYGDAKSAGLLDNPVYAAKLGELDKRINTKYKEFKDKKYDINRLNQYLEIGSLSKKDLGVSDKITLMSPSGKSHQWDEGDPEIEEARKQGWK